MPFAFPDGHRVHDEIIYELNRAFITPIDREDILLVAHDIDKITDNIENVAFRLWMFNVTALRPEMQEFVELIRKCCGKAAEVLAEFGNFKKSKVILTLIRQLSEYEHEDVETLQDVIVAAVNEAYKSVESKNAAEMEKITGALSLPGMF